MGIGCFSRWVPDGAGMATPGITLAQSFENITCFRCTCNPDRQVFFCLVGVFEHAGHLK